MAAFGNKYAGDGPLLSWVKKKKADIVEPVLGMINGGKVPEKYQNYF